MSSDEEEMVKMSPSSLDAYYEKLKDNLEGLEDYVHFYVQLVKDRIYDPKLSLTNIDTLRREFKRAEGAESRQEFANIIDGLVEEHVSSNVLEKKEFLTRATEYVIYKKRKSLEPKNSKSLFDELDSDGNGEISFSEYVKASAPKSTSNLSELRQNFKEFDANGDGIITRQEFERKIDQGTLH